MKNKTALIATILSSCLVTACMTSPQISQSDVQHSNLIQHEIAQNFTQANTQGVLLFQRNNQIVMIGNQLARVDQAFIPASSFKILNALIALEHHKVTTDEIFKWNGQVRAYKHWQKDMNMVEAMQLSTVPVYQEIARRIGLDLMQAEIKRLHYGNENIGNVIDRFWLDGPLKITPRQSLDFISKLSENTLPIKPKVQHTVQDMLLIEKYPTFKLYGKTGWGTAKPYDVGWLVGWIETSSGEKIPYVLNMQMKDGMKPNVRKELLIKSLQKLNII